MHKNPVLITNKEPYLCKHIWAALNGCIAGCMELHSRTYASNRCSWHLLCRFEQSPLNGTLRSPPVKGRLRNFPPWCHSHDQQCVLTSSWRLHVHPRPPRIFDQLDYRERICNLFSIPEEPIPFQWLGKFACTLESCLWSAGRHLELVDVRGCMSMRTATLKEMK